PTIRPPPPSPLLPYTTLFRSPSACSAAALHVAAAAASLLEVLLVVVLGPPERRGRRDLGDDRSAEATRPLELVERSAGGVLLLGVVDEDGRAVLVADVGPLAVELGGIVTGPEDVEQLLVGDPLGVVVDLERLGVARLVRAHV